MFPYYVFLISFLFIPHTLQSDCMNLNNCATCNTSVQPPVCLSCLSQNYLLDGECNACDSSIYNCTLCNQTLNNSIYPYFSQCVNCSQCSNNCLNSFCVSCSPTQCFTCSSNYDLDNNYQCNSCSDFCQNCYGPNDINCLSCPDGTYLSNDTCLNCDPSCNTCNSSNNCLTCNSGGTLTQNDTCQYLRFIMCYMFWNSKHPMLILQQQQYYVSKSMYYPRLLRKLWGLP